MGTQVGDMRIVWDYVPCCNVNVIAQQMENLQSSKKYTFRKWNPEKEMVALGEDNDSLVDHVIPKPFICCHFVQTGFKEHFGETIDVL